MNEHKAIGKLPKPKRGWTLPGHKYTGPYNDLENQVRYNPETGEILEVYDAPTGKTDAIAFSNSLIIHQFRTKEITTVKEVWIPGLN